MLALIPDVTEHHWILLVRGDIEGKGINENELNMPTKTINRA